MHGHSHLQRRTRCLSSSCLTQRLLAKLTHPLALQTPCSAPATAAFSVGDKVEARASGKKKKWTAGVVAKVHGNGTYNVLYGDGETGKEVQSGFIRSRADSLADTRGNGAGRICVVCNGLACALLSPQQSHY